MKNYKKYREYPNKTDAQIIESLASELSDKVETIHRLLNEISGTESKIEKTQRGFDRFNFKDQHGTECSLQKSSIATEDCIWLGSNKIGLKEFVAYRQPSAWVDMDHVDVHTMEHHFVANTRMHLTREQVAELLPMLQRFVHTGELS